MAAARYLIVNADDFGRSPGVNSGIVRAYEQGIVTSASLMVRWPAVREAVVYAQAHPDLSVGLHLDLGEWAYRGQAWVPLYEVVDLKDPEAVSSEVWRQIATFRQLTGRDPTHLDSHQHIHKEEALVRSLLLEFARITAVPLRHYSSVEYCGGFYGQTAKGEARPDLLSIGRLLEIVKTLPPGLTELACHPAAANDLDTMYGSERLEELKVLCDPQLRETIEAHHIQLCSFQGSAEIARPNPDRFPQP
jgi:predicted glycoside hydrolase/deacetylase ChbG (UPF0249 family)